MISTVNKIRQIVIAIKQPFSKEMLILILEMRLYTAY